LAAEDGARIRGMALDAWRDIRRCPLMWLILSAASLPVIFHLYFLTPGSPASLYLLFLLIGSAVCFVPYFLFWCMAVFFYHGKEREKEGASYGDAYALMTKRSRPASLAGAVCGLLTAVAFMVAQIVVSMILSFMLAGQVSDATLLILSLVNFYLSYLVADLALVFIAMVPQMICLEKGNKAEEVIRASYQVVKARYHDALILFIIPELVTRTLFLGASIVMRYLPNPGLLFSVLLVCMALLEGARTAFVAAAFNRFYYRVLEEEKEKKRKAKSKKQPAKKKAGKK